MRFKKKRDMERAFLDIRTYTNQKALDNLHKFYSKGPELRIMLSLSNRIFSKPYRAAIEKIRLVSLRRSRVSAFVESFESKIMSGVFKTAAKTFWTVLLT